MEININDRRLFMIDAYLMPFKRDIAKAKEHYDQEISHRIAKLEQRARKNSPHLRAIQALKEGKDLEYYLAFVEVSAKYPPLERLGLQKDTYLALKNKLDRQKPPEPQPKPAPEPEPTEQTFREKYATLAESYGQENMYELRQKIEANEATEDELLIFFTYILLEQDRIKKDKTYCLMTEDRQLVRRMLRTIQEEGKLEEIIRAFGKEITFLKITPDKKFSKILLRKKSQS